MLPFKTMVGVVRVGAWSQLNTLRGPLLCNDKPSLRAGLDQKRIFSISKGRLAQSPDNVTCAALAQW